MSTETRKQKHGKEPANGRFPEILDVAMAAAYLTVSRDTVYGLFQKGELPGRKVGRKWVTTKAAVTRWLEESAANHTMQRTVDRGGRDALADALKAGKIRVKTHR